ncbi:toxin-activating lysine-acyltransferase [Luteibacter pinisoli]|uniref:RTX toxin-activating lysine-acyltransferase n=1 Tax=Luteibacter pinisoli TaxID=2589080 RepID=A0A4Y5Z5E6_9GAMM|nr:toxin-activating lysine-acyltransferase [Luteibacter pinisoli]QDE40690.1 toxin-activating lysine-acyltransferase [Luteibacter pinisoli]
MMHGIRELDREESADRQKRFAEHLGRIVVLYADSAVNHYPMFMLKRWLFPALDQGQYAIFADEDDRVVAMVSWAFLDARRSRDMAEGDIGMLHPSEWSEGLNLWVVDFVAPYGHARAVTRYLRDVIFREKKLSFGVKRNAEGEVIRTRQFSRQSGGREAAGFVGRL